MEFLKIFLGIFLYATFLAIGVFIAPIFLILIEHEILGIFICIFALSFGVALAIYLGS